MNAGLFCPFPATMSGDHAAQLNKRSNSAFKPENFVLVRKSSCTTLISGSDVPASPTSIFEEIDFLQQRQEADYYALQCSAATAIQAILRGTLARWNFQVLKLQNKLASIQALKNKQLRKIEQRKVQTMRAARQEREYREEHRIVRRRLRSAKVVRNHMAKQRFAAIEENQQLRASCQQLAMQNDESARILSSFIQSMEVAKYNLNASKATMAHLQDTCRAHQTVVDVFQDVVAAQPSSIESS